MMAMAFLLTCGWLLSLQLLLAYGQDISYSPWMCLDMESFLYQPQDAPFVTLDCAPRLVSMDKLPVVSAILNVTTGPYASHHQKALDMRLNKVQMYTHLSRALLDLTLSKNKSSDMAKDDYALQKVVFEDFLQNVSSTFDKLREIRGLTYKMKATVHKRLDLAKFYRYELRGETEETLSELLQKVNHTDLHDAVHKTFGLIRQVHTDKLYCDWLNRSRDSRLTANDSPCLSPDHLAPKMKSMKNEMEFQIELPGLLVKFEAREAEKRHERARKWARKRRKQYSRVRNYRRNLKRKGGTLSRLRNMRTIARHVLYNITSSSKVSRRCARNLRNIQNVLDTYQELQNYLKTLYEQGDNLTAMINRCPNDTKFQKWLKILTTQTIPTLMREARSLSLKLKDRKTDLDDVISYYSKMAASIREHSRLFSSDVQLRMRRLDNAMAFARRYTFVLGGLQNVTDDITQAQRDTRNATGTLKKLRRLLNSVVVYIPPPTTITTTTPTTTTKATTTSMTQSTTITTRKPTKSTKKPTKPTKQPKTEKPVTTTLSTFKSTPKTTAPKTEIYTNFWGEKFSRVATKPTKPAKTTQEVVETTAPMTSTESTTMTDATSPTTASTLSSTRKTTPTTISSTASTTETITSTTETTQTVTTSTQQPQTTPTTISSTASSTEMTTSATETTQTVTTSTQQPSTTLSTFKSTPKTTKSISTVPEGYEIEYYIDFWGKNLTRFVKITTPEPSTVSTSAAQTTIRTTTEDDYYYDYSDEDYHDYSGDDREVVTLPDDVTDTTTLSTTAETTWTTSPMTSSTIETTQTSTETAPATTQTETTSVVDVTEPYTGEYETYTNYWGDIVSTRHITKPTKTTTTARGFWNGRRRKREVEQPFTESPQRFTTQFWKLYYKKLAALDAELSANSNNNINSSSVAKVRDKRAWFWDEEAATAEDEQTTSQTTQTTMPTTKLTKVTPLWPVSTHSKWLTSQRISSVDDNGDIIGTSTMRINTLPQVISVTGSDEDAESVDDSSGDGEDISIVTLAPPGDRDATIEQTVWQLRQDLQDYVQRSQADVLDALRLKGTSKDLSKQHKEIMAGLNDTDSHLDNVTSAFTTDFGNLTSLEPRLTSLHQRHDDVMKRMESLRDAAADILEKVNHTRFRLREVRIMVHVATPGEEVKDAQTAQDEYKFVERRVWAKHRKIEAIAKGIQSNFTNLRDFIGKAMKNVNSIQPVFSVEQGSFAQTRLPYDAILPSLKSTIHFHVRTLSPDGTFFSITDPRVQTGQGRKIKLAIVDGRPLAEWMDSSFVTNVTTRRPINDGNWHTIKLDKVGRSWTMTEFLSPHREAALSGSTTLPFWAMVGYSPHMLIWSSREQPSEQKKDPRKVDFKACLTNVIVNGKIVRPETKSFNASSESECHSTSQYANLIRLSREVPPLLEKNHCLAQRAQTLMLPYGITNDTLAFSFRQHDNYPGTLLFYQSGVADLFVLGVSSGHVTWEGRIRGQSFRRMCYELFPGDRVWHHVVVVFEEDATSLYVDNRICATVNMAVMTFATRSPMMFVYTAYRGRLVTSLPSRQPLMTFHGDIKHFLYNNRLFPVHQNYPCGRKNLQSYRYRHRRLGRHRPY